MEIFFIKNEENYIVVTKRNYDPRTADEAEKPEEEKAEALCTASKAVRSEIISCESSRFDHSQCE